MTDYTRNKVPLPFLVSPPLPEMTLDTVMSRVTYKKCVVEVG